MDKKLLASNSLENDSQVSKRFAISQNTSTEAFDVLSVVSVFLEYVKKIFSANAGFFSQLPESMQLSIKQQMLIGLLSLSIVWEGNSIHAQNTIMSHNTEISYNENDKLTISKDSIIPLYEEQQTKKVWEIFRSYVRDHGLENESKNSVLYIGNWAIKKINKYFEETGVNLFLASPSDIALFLWVDEKKAKNYKSISFKVDKPSNYDYRMMGVKYSSFFNNVQSFSWEYSYIKEADELSFALGVDFVNPWWSIHTVIVPFSEVTYTHDISEHFMRSGYNKDIDQKNNQPFFSPDVRNIDEYWNEPKLDKGAAFINPKLAFTLWLRTTLLHNRILAQALVWWTLGLSVGGMNRAKNTASPFIFTVSLTPQARFPLQFNGNLVKDPVMVWWGIDVSVKYLLVPHSQKNKLLSSTKTITE